MINTRDNHFLKYRLYGLSYLKFYKSLKKLGIEFLIEHNEELFYLKRYEEYGFEYWVGRFGEFKSNPSSELSGLAVCRCLIAGEGSQQASVDCTFTCFVQFKCSITQRPLIVKLMTPEIS